MLVIRAGNSQNDCQTENREEPDSDLDLYSLSRSFWQATSV